MTYTDEELILELQRFYRENGRTPKQLDMNIKNGYPAAGAYTNHFGSFNNALEITGFKINKTNEYRIGLETCCKCGNHLKKGSNWITKGLPKGQVICKSCYENPDYKNGNLNKESSTGKGTISEQIVKNVLNLEERHDCNFACGFGYKVDLYHKGRYKYINVKDSALHNSEVQSPYWYFNLTQKVIPDTYIILGYDENRKNILHVWITDAIDDLVFNENKMEYKKNLGITNIPESFKKAEPWEVDVKPYNDMLHLMSEKRKDNNGDGCFLRNDDLRK